MKKDIHIKNALELKSDLDKLRPISKEREARILQKFRLDWNYHSNHLEGNSLTFGETKMLIMHGITAGGKPLKDSLEITGHDEAIKLVEEVVKSERPLTENFIRELHVLLLREPYKINAVTPDGLPTKKLIEVGKYKSTPNHVKTKTGEMFYFATPEETPAQMNDLLDWYRKKSAGIDVNPISLAAEFHYKFIRIHPFDDGNGRTVRILMNFILMKFGFPPVIIKTEDRENYFLALRQADVGLIENFIDYIAKNLVRSLKIMIAGAKGEEIEEPSDTKKKIILLKPKFNRSASVKILKTKEAVLDIYDGSVVKIWDELIASCKEFDGFYVKNFFELNLEEVYDPRMLTPENPIYVPRKFLGAQNTMIDARNIALCRDNIDVERIVMRYGHEGLNRQGFGYLNFNSEIEFRFSLETYSLKSSHDQRIITKEYGEQLTDSEIKEIIKLEEELHLKFIEEKLEEEKKEKN